MDLVGQAANIAQLAGVDAYGLIKMIAEAAQTVRRNKATCLQLARRAKMIGDLLRQLHAAQLMQQPETRNPVEGLEETLRRAYNLVRSCQGRSYLYQCFMGGRHADELREVQGDITFYLQLFPLVNYVDTTLLQRGTYGLQSSRVRAAVAGTSVSVHQPSTVDERRVGCISMLPSHASTLQLSQEKVPLSETEELEVKHELNSCNRAQVQCRCEAPAAVKFKKR